MLNTILLVLALVCFLVASFGYSVGRLNLTALGLFFLTLTFVTI